MRRSLTPSTALTATGAAVSVLLLSACTTASDAPPGQPTISTISTIDTSTGSLSTGDGTVSAAEPHDDLEVTLGAVPSWDLAAQAEAGVAASTAVGAYVSGGTEEAWWARVAPLLSPVAQRAYAGTDPANVPGRQVEGASAAATDAGSAYLARVVVPTDAGDYEVLLSRTGAGAPWLVERFRVPEQEPRP